MMARPLVSRRLHLVVLENNKPSPLLSNSQPNPEVKTDERANDVRIDFEEIHRRIVTLPLQPRDYTELASSKPGSLYALVTEWPKSPGIRSQETLTLYHYSLSKPREMEKLVEGLNQFVVSADGEKLLYRRGQAWTLVDGDKAAKPDSARLDLKALEIKVDPAAEYKQIFHEAWRVMRDYFYDPNHHGQNLAELERHYSEYLPSVARRADLNDLMRQMLGHISVSHLGVGGGDAPPARPAQPHRVVGRGLSRGPEPLSNHSNLSLGPALFSEPQRSRAARPARDECERRRVPACHRRPGDRSRRRASLPIS